MRFSRDELAAIIRPGLFQGTPDEELEPSTLRAREAARSLVSVIRNADMDGEETVTFPVRECDGWGSPHPSHIYDWTADGVIRYCKGEGN